jgi:hypothetical protein
MGARATGLEELLAAPPGVSPASATAEKEHQQNDQYEFHVETSLNKRKVDRPLEQPLHFFTTLILGAA